MTEQMRIRKGLRESRSAGTGTEGGRGAWTQAAGRVKVWRGLCHYRGQKKWSGPQKEPRKPPLVPKGCVAFVVRQTQAGSASAVCCHAVFSRLPHYPELWLLHL